METKIHSEAKKLKKAEAVVFTKLSEIVNEWSVGVASIHDKAYLDCWVMGDLNAKVEPDRDTSITSLLLFKQLREQGKWIQSRDLPKNWRSINIYRRQHKDMPRSKLNLVFGTGGGCRSVLTLLLRLHKRVRGRLKIKVKTF